MISIVIPTRDRPRDLERCLAALTSDEHAAQREILVVDDGSRDGAAVAAAVSRAPGARLVAGRGAGPAAARNAGARAARGAVICFTDDDCEPAPGWAGRLAAALVDGVSLVAGATLNARPEDRFAAASQAMTNYLADHGAVPFAPSSNVGCWADVARSLPFDESYPAAAGEDRDWCVRLAAAGHTLTREPRAVVRHHQRLGAAGFVRQQLRYGRGAYRFHRGGAPDEGVREPLRFYGGLLAHGAREGPVVGGLVAGAQAIVAAGYAAEAGADRIAARRHG